MSTATIEVITTHIGDLVIIDLGIVGKYAYKVSCDFLGIFLTNSDNQFEYQQRFDKLKELDAFIHEHSDLFNLVSLAS